MNKLTIIGNLTRDPELRTTQSGVSVCAFTVAVNRRRSTQSSNQPEADYFRVSVWRELGEACHKYLAKGRKVAVVGAVSVSTYKGNDGETRASLDVNAEEVEFLTPRDASTAPAASAARTTKPVPEETGFTLVDDEDLPF